jgi:hypothetical protein
VLTPGYLKGKRGRVESVLGAFPNPEDLAYGLSGLPERSLYRVGFRQADLWDDYEGPAEDSLHADVYEHWLEPGEGGTA